MCNLFNRNADIKQAKGKIPNWAIAEKLGVSEQTWYLWLRKELDPEVKERVFAIIDELKTEMEKEKKNA